MNGKTLDFDLRDMTIYRGYIIDSDTYNDFMKRLRLVKDLGEDVSLYERQAMKYLIGNLYRQAVKLARTMDFTTVKDTDGNYQYHVDSTKLADLGDVLDEFEAHLKEYGISEDRIRKSRKHADEIIDRRKNHYISLHKMYSGENKNGNGNNQASQNGRGK